MESALASFRPLGHLAMLPSGDFPQPIRHACNHFCGSDLGDFTAIRRFKRCAPFYAFCCCRLRANRPVFAQQMALRLRLSHLPLLFRRNRALARGLLPKRLVSGFLESWLARAALRWCVPRSDGPIEAVAQWQSARETGRSGVRFLQASPRD